MEEKLRWIFSLYDTNHDGQITVEEMTEIVGAIYNLLGYSPETKSPSFDFDTIVNDTVTRLFQVVIFLINTSNLTVAGFFF